MISEPSDGLVTGMPRPRNDRAASLMMALATCTVEMTSTGERVLGRMCRHMMRMRGRPMILAASTYSFLRSASTEARTVRAYCGHSARPMMAMSRGTATLSYPATPNAVWTMAPMKMATMYVENESCTSAMRMRKVSSRRM